MIYCLGFKLTQKTKKLMSLYRPIPITYSKFPALSQNKMLRFLSLSALYLAQGIPEGILWFGLPAWMAMNGKSPAEIGGFVAILGLPWSFKLFAAPIIDRFTYLRLGRRRPWILFGQFGLTISFLSMAFIDDPLNNMAMLRLFGFLVGFFAVIQDIAVDGLAIDILPEDQQARANGLMWGTKTVGISASVAAGVYIINQYGFFYAISSFSILVFAIMLIPMLIKERPCEKKLPWSKKGGVSKNVSQLQAQSWKAVFLSLFRVFFLPVSFVMGVAAFSFSVGRGLMDTLLPVFTVQHLGWTDTAYSGIFSLVNLGSGILGMFVAGILIDKYGKIRMMRIYLSLLISALVAVVLLKPFWSSPAVITSFIAVFYVLITFTTIAIFAAAMNLCWKRISATQFTLYMAISNLGLASGAWLLGPLTSMMSWEYVLAASVAFPLIMLALTPFFNFETHLIRVGLLEAKYTIPVIKLKVSEIA
jgi:MFS transporter, PAT family, beta-lactamase induction signal transducer AmpG